MENQTTHGKIKDMKSLRGQKGFALPTVVIASLLLVMALGAALSASTSTRTAMVDQYYNQMAREAAESGIAHSQGCLEQNNYVPQWSGGNKLYPNTDCTGGTSCSISTCYVAKTTQYSYGYSVDAPANPTATPLTIRSTGTVSLLRTSGTVWKTYTQTVTAKIGPSPVRSIVLGYSNVAPTGSFFGVVGSDGTFKTAGQNNYGQLGVGNTTASTTPQKFDVSGKAVTGFSNNLSSGTAMFVLMSDGTVYAAGRNTYGQLGVGDIGYGTYVATPALVQMPVGQKVVYVATLGDATTAATYFITSDGGVYSAGSCNTSDMLGYSCASDQKTPKQVITPTSDPNTQAMPNIVVDRLNVYVRMRGGRVYGWGVNDFGELGYDSKTASVTPVKIGTYGDSSQPSAVDVATDGSTVYIIDSTGSLKSLGMNRFGESGSRTSQIYMSNTNGKCMSYPSGPTLAVCDSTSANQRMSLRADGTIYNAGANVCLTVNADNTWLSWAACTAAANQVWSFDAASTQHIVHTATGKCLENNNNDGTTIWVATCGLFGKQIWDLYNAVPTQFNMAGISGAVTAMSTDQYGVSILTSAGEVWSAGYNFNGYFGAGGGTVIRQADPVRFAMPVAARYIYETSSSLSNNLYAVGADGRVYAAGANDYGQLGNCTSGSGTYSGSPVAMKLLIISGTYTPCTTSVNAAEDLTASTVVSGGGTTVVIMGDNRVFSVGNNSNGQLGDGTTTNSSEPKTRQYFNTMPPAVY